MLTALSATHAKSHLMGFRLLWTRIIMCIVFHASMINSPHDVLCAVNQSSHKTGRKSLFVSQLWINHFTLTATNVRIAECSCHQSWKDKDVIQLITIFSARHVMETVSESSTPREPFTRFPIPSYQHFLTCHQSFFLNLSLLFPTFSAFFNAVGAPFHPCFVPLYSSSESTQTVFCKFLLVQNFYSKNLILACTISFSPWID